MIAEARAEGPPSLLVLAPRIELAKAMAEDSDHATCSPGRGRLPIK